MFVHDYIKLMYTNIGYLPGYPYYLISDDEMFNAFTKVGGFFDAYYPCPCSGECPCDILCPGYTDPTQTKLVDAYNTLRKYINDTISEYQEGKLDSLPDWIYSYMIGSCIGIQSEENDLYYLNDLLKLSTTKGEPEFTVATAIACYNVSSAWLKKQPTRVNKRPPTLFGEPHVIKSLRLDQANILMEGT